MSARVFTTKAFARLAHGVVDCRSLCRAVEELEQGKGDDLGGGVWKKRVNRNRARAIVATKAGVFWIFVYLFSKNDRENIDVDELAAFKKLAKDYGSHGTAGIEKLIAQGSMKEICNDCHDSH
ncbi:MAG: type II toxin-antitoxin system RelE/ParE family toxin [Gammaproteobacteria bacterium]|nr:type II toxin-antitoxin system RelE/ParE family toxin [Gammaproteobacteria bacterium]MBU1440144.1 type II toxin-antitoxin system RelE/ParE family toxin [Gammaproteobacteria bacterium]MBU2287664.1 type II toxin-antitoxin system RelE/ParE family toxin [Gammaproteobacteria bacterium]MBU2410033.1 type II toxin-antitoxin system RelE/ParE family toxin [Gammaproteobacteria bacterium]